MNQNEILQNRIKAVNAIHELLNAFVPKIRKFLEGYKGKKIWNLSSQSLSDKFKKELEVILPIAGDKIRVYCSVNYSMFSLEISHSYKTNPFSCDYFKNSSCIAQIDRKTGVLTEIFSHEVNFKTDYDLKTILAKQAELENLRKQVSKLESAISPVIKK